MELLPVSRKCKRGCEKNVTAALKRVDLYEKNTYQAQQYGGWAGRLCTGLQIRVDRFDSGTRLQFTLI